jgi:hypothetical protein
MVELVKPSVGNVSHWGRRSLASPSKVIGGCPAVTMFLCNDTTALSTVTQEWALYNEV